MSQTNSENPRKGELGIDFDFWQHRSKSMLRVNQKVLDGLMQAAMRQMELGRDLVRHNFSIWRPTENSENAASLVSFTKARAEYHRQGIEQFVIGMQKITGEAGQCFSEATQLLLEDDASANHEASTAMSGFTRGAANAVIDGMTARKAQKAA